ncbi:MAG: Eco57I restriction-modification methylase domain-containing protein [Planctomycetaceae bacterium]|nr:Eco57I restriction-modification methylase domain-containing protein [Planctomycetaceae bacterium]
MKLYAFETPEIEKHKGYLKIGETHGSIEERVKQQGYELNVKKEIVWNDAVYTDRSGIDKRLHRHLVQQGFLIQKFDETGNETEWVKCTVADLERAFEKVKQQIYDEEKRREEVGNQFYLEIRNWYYWANGPEGRQTNPDAPLRLIVRLLFCCFLQEKELVPKELFDEHFLKEHLRENEEYRYHNAVLRNLFFHCLNTPITERQDVEYKKLIKNVRRIKEQFDKIPFLNGGIFNEHDGDEVPLNDDYFFSELRTRHLPELGGNYQVAGLIRILSQYHYKLSLDDLLDHADYARTIDPEFIGKVFECLLACIEADSKENRRKVTGSYYTPREVVNYMVNEALETYLETADNRRQTTEESTAACKLPSADVLLECRILDPACGSGAFPCEIMNEIMRRLDPHGTLPQSEQYRRKLEILQKVIYGVDIQPMAVQISQLRLFLSLIQDIVSDKRRPNHGIEPLPNLETKFVCADALIGLKNGRQRRLELPIVREQIKQLREIRSRHFMASSVQEKQSLRQLDESSRKMLAMVMEDAGDLAQDTAEKLVAWNPYDQSHVASFFDPVWMFGLEKFDIVIGNPPYIQLQKRGGTLARQYANCGYETFAKTGDIYTLFYERGWQLLVEGGHLCFITSNKWMRAEYGEPLRKFLSEKTNPKKLIDFAGTQVFESSTVDVNILLFTKEENRHQTLVHTLKNVADLKKLAKQETMSFSPSSSWVILSPIERQMKEKIESVGIPLKDWDIQINFGIKTGFNDAFVINGTKKAELIAADPKSAEIIKPILRGRDVRRYGYEFADMWLINTHNGIKEKGIKPVNIDDYPAIREHLDLYFPQLEKRGDQGDTPYNLRNCAYLEDFEKPKIIYPDVMRMPRNEEALNEYPRFYYDDENSFFLCNDLYFITGKDIDLLYLFLASDVGFYVFSKFYTGIQFDETGFRYMKASLNELFVPRFDKLTTKRLRAAITNTHVNQDTVEKNIVEFCRFSEKEKEVIRMYKKQLLSIESEPETAPVLTAITGQNRMAFTSSPWVLQLPIEERIKKKIEAIGKPLKEWDVQIYRGVTTGANDAFVIDGAKRAELIAADPNSAKVIRPILRGRDIRRYGHEFADYYLITTFPSLQIDINQYPAVKKHLLSFGKRRLEQSGKRGARKQTNHHWFEIQDSTCYWEDFEKPKIVYPDVMRMPRNEEALDDYPKFYYDTENSFFLCNDLYFITGKDIDLLFLFLSSDVGFYIYSKFYIGLQFDTTGFRYNKAYLNELFVPRFDERTIKRLRAALKNIVGEKENIEKIIEDFCHFNKKEKETIRAYKKQLLSVERQH